MLNLYELFAEPSPDLLLDVQKANAGVIPTLESRGIEKNDPIAVCFVLDAHRSQITITFGGERPAER